MIFRHFSDPTQNRNSYLVASTLTREAAIIDPLETCMDGYEAFLDQRGLKLVYTLQTRNDRSSTRAGQTLRMRRASSQILPFQAVALDPDSAKPIDHRAKPGASFALGDLTIETVEPLSSGDSEVSYRVCDYVFSPNEIRIVDTETKATGLSSTFEPAETGTNGAPRSGSGKLINNRRTTREGVPVEMLILEDLHSSLIENRSAPKKLEWWRPTSSSWRTTISFTRRRPNLPPCSKTWTAQPFMSWSTTFVGSRSNKADSLSFSRDRRPSGFGNSRPSRNSRITKRNSSTHTSGWSKEINDRRPGLMSRASFPVTDRFSGSGNGRTPSVGSRRSSTSPFSS